MPELYGKGSCGPSLLEQLDMGGYCLLLFVVQIVPPEFKFVQVLHLPRHVEL
jgi:hypothetical protein